MIHPVLFLSELHSKYECGDSFQKIISRAAFWQPDDLLSKNMTTCIAIVQGDQYRMRLIYSIYFHTFGKHLKYLRLQFVKVCFEKRFLSWGKFSLLPLYFVPYFPSVNCIIYVLLFHLTIAIFFYTLFLRRLLRSYTSKSWPSG